MPWLDSPTILLALAIAVPADAMTMADIDPPTVSLPPVSVEPITKTPAADGMTVSDTSITLIGDWVASINDSSAYLLDTAPTISLQAAQGADIQYPLSETPAIPEDSTPTTYGDYLGRLYELLALPMMDSAVPFVGISIPGSPIEITDLSDSFTLEDNDLGLIGGWLATPEHEGDPIEQLDSGPTLFSGLLKDLSADSYALQDYTPTVYKPAAGGEVYGIPPIFPIQPLKPLSVGRA